MGAKSVGMGTGTTGTVGDGDEFLSPCSSLIDTQLQFQLKRESYQYRWISVYVSIVVDGETKA